MNTIFIFYPKIRKIKSDFAENLQSRVIPGGDKRDRTADLLNAILKTPFSLLIFMKMHQFNNSLIFLFLASFCLERIRSHNNII